MTDELERDFKGIWIPKEIWLDKRLNTIDKIVLLEIDSLDCAGEGCYASNKYLADFCQCTEWTISCSINRLINLGYLELVGFDGRKRYLKSSLVKIQRQTCENPKADFGKSQDINIYNNIINNKKENKKERFKPPSFEEVEKYCIERNNGINAQKFIDFYESKGWMIGKNKMKNWKACIRTWETKNKVETPKWFNNENKVEKTTIEDDITFDELLKGIESE